MKNAHSTIDENLDRPVRWSFARQSSGDVSGLIERACRAYRLSVQRRQSKDASPLWDGIISDNNRLTREAILRGENPPEMSTPAKNSMFFGFDNTHVEMSEKLKTNAVLREEYADWITNTIVLLAEAVGVKRVWNPEGGAAFPNKEKPAVPSPDELLDQISSHIGTEIDFPNPFPDEFGLRTSRGIANERSVQAIYQAWRIKQLTLSHGKKVAEIGAGLGRTAYYAYKMGVTNYTIIDIPFTNLSQANFLGRAISPEAIALAGERPRAGAIRIVSSGDGISVGDFDVVANVDSLTEMGAATSMKYAREFSRARLRLRKRAFWSVNHEANQEIVSRLTPMRHLLSGRFPYWLRTGYVEELFTTR